jgi:FAD synthase
VIIAHNIFTRNAGYLDASAVFIRARGISGQSVTSTIPNVGSLFCAGYHFEGNTFTENLACPQYGGALIKMECVEYTDGSTLINDQYTYGSISAANQALYFSPFPSFTPVALS